MSREMQSNVRTMLQDGQKRFELGQAEFKRSLDAQIKDNHESVAKIHTGAREIQASQEKMSQAFLKAGRDIRESGCRNLQSGLKEFRGIVGSQIMHLDRQLLDRAVANLLSNAITATSQGNCVTLSSMIDESHGVSIVVEDTRAGDFW